MDVRISEELSRIIDYARDEAMRTGAYEIGTDHILLGMIRDRENEACSALTSLGADLDDLKNYLDAQVFHRCSVPYPDSEQVRFSPEARNTLNLSILESSMAKHSLTGPMDLLLAICRSSRSVGKMYLEARGINHETVSSFSRQAHETHAEPVQRQRVVEIFIQRSKYPS